MTKSLQTEQNPFPPMKHSFIKIFFALTLLFAGVFVYGLTAEAAATKGMVVYIKGATSTPAYRVWDGSSWGAEGLAQDGQGGTVKFSKLEFALTRDEAILGTMNSEGDIVTQIWNGSSWGTPKIWANVGTVNDEFRGFDIKYEKSNDRAILVYNDGNSADPSYAIWDGEAWSASSSIASPPTTGAPVWIEMAAKPTSTTNEVVMMLVDENTNIYGMQWDGSTWGTMGSSTVWDVDSGDNGGRIDVAYEQNSGNAMFIWTDAQSTDNYYVIWDGSTLTNATLLDISDMGGVGDWVLLAPRPGSDEILFGIQDGLLDLSTRKWSGSAWDTSTEHPEHDASVEQASSRNFDIVWETHPAHSGQAWMWYGDGGSVTRKAWNTASSSWGAGVTSGDDTMFVAMEAHPGTGALWAFILQDDSSASDDILDYRLTGGTTAWAGASTTWGGPTVAAIGFESIALAYERLGSVVVTYLGDGTDPSNATIAPGANATSSDAFTFKTLSGTDSITQVTTTLAANTTSGIAKVEIISSDGATVYGSTTNPTANSFSITLNTPISVTTATSTYYIRITPKSHANMPAPSLGAEYAVTSTISGWTGTNTQKSVRDTDSATITIDNLATNSTNASGTRGDTLVSLSWVNSADSDYSTTTVFRATSSIGDTAPTEGTSYSTSTAINATTTVVCVVRGSAGANVTCTDTGLTNGTAYHYKIFTQDSRGNHSTGTVPTGSPITPQVASPDFSQIHYRWRNDTGMEMAWTTSTIYSAGAPAFISIAAPSGTSEIYVSYYDGSSSDLILAKSTSSGATWIVSTVDAGGTTGLFTSIAAPSGTSTIYISYQESGQDNLQFAKSTNGGTTWTTSTIDSGSSTQDMDISMIAPSGTSTIYISYLDANLRDLLFAKSTDGGTTWTTSTIDSNNVANTENSITAPSGTSTIYVSYFNGNNDLFFAKSTNGGTTWTTSTIDASSSVNTYTSITAPSGTSTIYISYFDANLFDLFFAKSTDGGTTWTTSTIDAGGSTGYYSSITAPSGTSTIYASYYDQNIDDLLFAESTNGGTTWTTSTLDSAGIRGLYTSITGIAGTSTIYISYRDSSQVDLLFAKSTTGGDTDFAAPQDTALTGLEKSSTTRLRFEISNEGDITGSSTFRLEYQANATSGAWTAVPASASSEHWELAGSSYITDGEATQNIASNGTSSLSDENATFVAGELRDARATTSLITLTSSQFTEIEYSIRATTTATDGGIYYFRLTNNGTTTNHSYVVYPKVTLAGQSNTQIHYRWRNDTGTETAWTTSTIDTGGSITGRYTSITAPSGTSTIYISYHQNSPGFDLLFAKSTNGGTTWTTSTVDEGGVNGFFTSIAAPSGTSTIYISYQESGQSDLLFAKSTNGGTTWTTSTVDAGNNTGAYSSITAPSGTSTIYISYEEGGQNDLLFAKSTNGGTTWTTSTIDANRSAGQFTSITAPSGTSTIYISYQQSTGSDLFFAKSTDGGATWTTSTVDTANSSGLYTSITAPSGTSTIYISYQEIGFDDLIFAKSTNGGTTWTTSTIDAGGTTGLYTSITAPSGTSTIYVSYQIAGTLNNLLFAKSTDGGTTWTTSTIDAGGTTGLYTSITAPSGTSTIYISYQENGQSNLLFAKTTTGGDSDFAAPEDTALTGLAKSSTTRLRFEISNEGVATAESTFRLEYQENSTSGSWTAVPASASSEHWELSDSSYITDGEETRNITASGTQALTDENTTFVAGELRDARATTSPITLTTSQFTEIEYSIRATTGATDSGVYYFRLTNNGSASNFGYPVYPKVTLGVGVSTTLAVSNHPQGQASNQFDITPAVVTDTVLFRYRLTPSASMSITTTTVQITNYSGFVEGNLTNFRLYHDVDNDGVLDADEPARHATGTVTLYTSTGTIVFGTAWTATTTSDIILIGTVASINDGDFITLSVSPSNILATGATVSGDTQSKNHFKPTTTFGGNASATGAPPSGVEQGGGDEGSGQSGGDTPPGGGEQGGGGAGGGGGSGGAPMLYCIFFPNSPFCVNLRSTLDATENTFQKILQWLWL